MSLPKPDYSVSKLPEHVHQRILLAALQVGRPVLYQGKTEYLYDVGAQQQGGQIVARVYLTGKPGPIAADEISLQTIIE